MKQHIDDHLGHITVHHDGSTEPFGVLVDSGDTVTVGVNGYFAGPWTTEEAREVGRALIGWAVRKEQDGG